jgi:glycosyltransferase involved in cell wall biosynthesis
VLEEIDVGVVPSIWEEVFGIVGLEYLNARIPVIASNIGGVGEWLRHGESGFLFQPGDDKALSGIMTELLDNPSEIVKLQRKMTPWKTMNEYAQEIDKLYHELA